MDQTKLLSLFPESDIRIEGVASALTALRNKANMCQRCSLHEGRKNVVFGTGNIDSPPIAFVGESPGPAEDDAGLPFVGRGGQLLDQMISAMGYKREDVYVCNVVNCRAKRKPEKEEVDACNMFLTGQLRIVKPKMIVAMGATAAQSLANSKKGIADLRNRWLEWKDKKSDLKIPMRATYHPTYLTKYPDKKSETWKDLQLVLSWIKGE